MVLKRFVKGIDEEAFFQKRAPATRPDWIEVAELHYASGPSAEEVVVRDAASSGLGGQPRLHRPQPAPGAGRGPRSPRRAAHRPRPGAGCRMEADRRGRARRQGGAGGPRADRLAEDLRLARLPHLHAHRPALVLPGRTARGRDRRPRGGEPRPDLATSKWWKEERQGVFVDFNQNAKDRTVASAYSVRPTPDARVSTPLRWAEVPDCRPEQFTLRDRARALCRDRRPVARASTTSSGSLEALLELAQRLGPAEKPPKGTGRRQSTMPLIEIARAKTKDEALAGLERWKARHPTVVAPSGAGRHPGRRDAWPKLALVPHPRQPPARSRSRAPGAGTPRGRLQPVGQRAVAARERLARR